MSPTFAAGLRDNNNLLKSFLLFFHLIKDIIPPASFSTTGHIVQYDLSHVLYIVKVNPTWWPALVNFCHNSHIGLVNLGQ